LVPFVLILLGVLLIVTGIRGTVFDLGRLVVGDFTGSGNFFYWIAALFIIGAIGYVDELRTPSRMFLALVIVALLFSNRGFFNQFVAQLKSGSAQAPPPVQQAAPATGVPGGTPGQSGGPLGAIGQVAQGVGAVASILGAVGL
jgi:hypothetical protein